MYCYSPWVCSQCKRVVSHTSVWPPDGSSGSDSVQQQKTVLNFLQTLKVFSENPFLEQNFSKSKTFNWNNCVFYFNLNSFFLFLIIFIFLLLLFLLSIYFFIYVSNWKNSITRMNLHQNKLEHQIYPNI